MSAEEAVTDALNKPVDQNAQSADEVKQMLAELEREAASKAPEKTNGATATSDVKQEAKIEGQPATTETEENPKVEKNDQTAETENVDETEVKGREYTEKPRERHNDRRERSDRGGRGRGRGRGNFQNRNYKENIKSDLTTQEESSDPVAIRKQVEFYFSDSNLPNDKFLLGKVGGSQNHAVEIAILHSFKRMRHFQPFEAIVEALKESKTLELTEDNTCVRRREPLPEALNDGPDPNAVRVFEDRAMPRSIYAKGFGEEVPSTQFDIEAFFTPYGPTNAVRLRRTNEKLFKGSVFVEFENEDLQKAFLELDPKPTFKGKELQIMSKKEYCDKKVDDIKTGKIRANKAFDKPGRREQGRGDRDFKRKRDDEDDRDWRERREDDRKNGFRDDKRRGDRGRDSRGGKPRHERDERDERGVPVVTATTDEQVKAKRDAGRAEAIAKAKAMVEAENKKGAGNTKQETSDNIESTEQDGEADATAKAGNVVESSVQADVEATTGNKRARDDDEGDVEREVKKVDLKAEVTANGDS